MGKSLLIVGGVGYGVIQAMNALAEEAVDPAEAEPHDSWPDRAAGSRGTRTTGTDGTQGQAERYESARSAEAESDLSRSHSYRETASSAPPTAFNDASLRRLDVMEERLIRMEKGLEILTAPLERAVPRAPGRNLENFVTRAEMNAAMEQFSSRLDADIERRFEVQNRSVQSLRTMIARTDELLEQVIESIESTSMTA